MAAREAMPVDHTVTLAHLADVGDAPAVFEHRPGVASLPASTIDGIADAKRNVESVPEAPCGVGRAVSVVGVLALARAPPGVDALPTSGLLRVMDAATMSVAQNSSVGRQAAGCQDLLVGESANPAHSASC